MNIKDEIKRELVRLGVVRPDVEFTINNNVPVDNGVIDVRMGGYQYGVFMWSKNTVAVTVDLFSISQDGQMDVFARDLCRQLMRGWA